MFQKPSLFHPATLNIVSHSIRSLLTWAPRYCCLEALSLFQISSLRISLKSYPSPYYNFYSTGLKICLLGNCIKISILHPNFYHDITPTLFSPITRLYEFHSICARAPMGNFCKVLLKYLKTHLEHSFADERNAKTSLDSSLLSLSIRIFPFPSPL